tara:strand:+ start:119613 stop:120563 length:951 start_codon:yes stop_codon:yes gene_type:complete
LDPLVSIIIPVYNKSSFIKETLDSAFGQTYPNIEVVLVNDGSTDDSLVILEGYKEKYPDKVVLIDQVNGGVSQANNVGIQASQGEYLQFLDADDLLSPDKIEKQIYLLNGQSPAVISSCEWVMFKEKPSEYFCIPYGIFKDFESGIECVLRFWNQQEMMQPAAYLSHRSLIEKAGDWDESLIINQDGEFFLRILLHANEVLYDPHGRVYYRQPGLSNVSQQKSEKAFISLLNSYQTYELNVLSVEDSDRVRKALKKVYQKFIYDCFPKYPHLIAKAEGLMKSLGMPEKTYIGGPKFQQVSKILGFKNALRLKRFMG